MKSYPQPRQFIGGSWLEPAGPGIDIIDPATEEVLAACPQASPADVAAALEAARSGMKAWRGKSPWQRSEILRRVSSLLRERIEDIAWTMTREIGKPLAEARVETMSAVEHFDWCADEARRIYDRSFSGRVEGSRMEIRHEPVGIVLALTAWNFPIGLAARKLAMALAAGCAVILRPASEAPATAAALIAACHDAGVPPGGVNLLLGAPEPIVDALMAEPDIRKVSFTGSTRVGQILMRQSATTLKKLTMELGGHAPFIVLGDVDVKKVAALAVTGKFRNAGQVCTSPTRFIVNEKIVDDFAELFVEGTRKLKIGNGLEDGVQIGPLATPAMRERAERLVADAKMKGATIGTGGKRPDGFNRGYYYEPTVIVSPAPDAAVLTEEPFGPMAIIQSVAGEDEAVAMANSLEYGLAAYLYTASADAAERVFSALQSGVIGVNNNVVAVPEGPFGGVKQSGFGREGGFEGVNEYLVTKFVHRNLPL